MKENQNIENYLDNILESEHELNLLLVGPWGVGKTYFIKHYFKNRDQKYYYVSLAGIESAEEFDDRISEVLQPVFYKKYEKIEKVVRATFEQTKLFTPVAGNVSLGILKLIKTFIEESLENQKINYPIIFDDLERCGMSPDSLFGSTERIKALLGLKLIFVANECKFKDLSAYQEVKEKYVEKTLTIRSDLQSYIGNIISEEIINDKVKKLLNNCIKDIIQVMHLANVSNMRTAKKVIRESSDFLQLFSEKHYSNTDHLSMYVKYISIVCCEVESGFSTVQDFLNINVYTVSYLVNKLKRESPEEPLSKEAVLFEKYNMISPNLLYENKEALIKLWLSSYGKNQIITKDQFKECLQRVEELEIFYNPIKLLQDITLYDDKELNEKFKDAMKYIKSGKIENFSLVTEFLKITSELISNDLISYKMDDIVSFLKENQNHILSNVKDDFTGKNWIEKYEKKEVNYFTGNQDPELNKCFEILIKILREKKEERLKAEAEKLFAMLSKGGSDLNTILLNNSQHQAYRIPLSLIDLNKMTQLLLKVSGEHNKSIYKFLNIRTANHELTSEDKLWLININNEISKSLDNYSKVINYKIKMYWADFFNYLELE